MDYSSDGEEEDEAEVQAAGQASGGDADEPTFDPEAEADTLQGLPWQLKFKAGVRKEWASFSVKHQ